MLNKWKSSGGWVYKTPHEAGYEHEQAAKLPWRAELYQTMFGPRTNYYLGPLQLSTSRGLTVLLALTGRECQPFLSCRNNSPSLTPSTYISHQWQIHSFRR